MFLQFRILYHAHFLCIVCVCVLCLQFYFSFALFIAMLLCRYCLNAFMLRIRTQLLFHRHRRRRRCRSLLLSLLPLRMLLSNQNPFQQTYWMNNGVKGLLFPEEKYSNNFKWLTFNLYSSTFASAVVAAGGGGVGGGGGSSGGGGVWCCCSSLPHTIHVFDYKYVIRSELLLLLLLLVLASTPYKTLSIYVE